MSQTETKHKANKRTAEDGFPSSAVFVFGARPAQGGRWSILPRRSETARGTQPEPRTKAPLRHAAEGQQTAWEKRLFPAVSAGAHREQAARQTRLESAKNPRKTFVPRLACASPASQCKCGKTAVSPLSGPPALHIPAGEARAAGHRRMKRSAKTAEPGENNQALPPAYSAPLRRHGSGALARLSFMLCPRRRARLIRIPALHRPLLPKCVFRRSSLQGKAGGQDAQGDPRAGEQESLP